MTTSFFTIQFMMAEHRSTQILSRKYFFVAIYKYTDIYRGIYILKSVSICIYTYIVIFLTEDRQKISYECITGFVTNKQPSVFRNKRHKRFVLEAPHPRSVLGTARLPSHSVSSSEKHSSRLSELEEFGQKRTL